MHSSARLLRPCVGIFFAALVSLSIQLHGQTPANETPACPVLSSDSIPLNQTIQLKLMGVFDSAHLKPGKKFYGHVVNSIVYPGCTLDADAVIYGQVTAASPSKLSPGNAELGLEFDRVECTGQSAKPMKLFVIAVLMPSNKRKDEPHGADSTEISGGGRKIGDATASMGGNDEGMSSGSKPASVHPGLVYGDDSMKIDPVGGPGCSAKITSTARSVRLETESELILTMAAPSAANGGH